MDSDWSVLAEVNWTKRVKSRFNEEINESICDYDEGKKKKRKMPNQYIERKHEETF